jgi:hypothetical protein
MGLFGEGENVPVLEGGDGIDLQQVIILISDFRKERRNVVVMVME